ncbi:conserved hypothetical protein [Xenorhabdus nematophila ATCC 19061]|uniref:ATP-binding protein n=1 Tax=Xenorhabdus nematophila (strain ATCC 19061 / DSM 3370 / CCUG 14189 / LMG 1036 / NCIMB 9965 / AN6) TaxID=406817 RepID=D3VDK1_XENNA|nr:ATP-binding protein [Xenorhabdus nematophila]CBJ92241.1 conserved hypothetical protein [Xenorhabdus nematophila ATCC 19061]CEK25056.1 conserved hypothetical protein [Xenorhabdus nematophila AN6/1]
MSQLLRIILIHTHLPGVVEIQLDAHANICGTNGAGKTTLQRLVPVFYGEQPNRVVPRTRKKFDEYYLPYSNSYIVYEYQRESGDICQVVLTRKSDGGIDYRFVSAPYQSDFYLPYSEENVQAFSYSEWAAAMRDRSDVQISPKLSATSEYRSIIQNDASALREQNSDSIKLRRLSASYSLASGHHRLRHIEKLVSAVHAKEGKMDTLKAMLAAIFEEDGVTLPTTKVKNKKALEWIQQMRHSLRSDKLQQDFESLKQLGHQLNDTEAQLAVLLPLIQDDEQQQKKNKADAETRVYQLRGQLRKLEEEYKEQQLNLNDRLSKTEADIKATVSQLNHFQREYDRYERLDIDQLQHDTNALPVWRENLKELADQYELMMEQHGDLERQLGQHKAKLEESYTQLSEQNRIKQKELQKQKEHTREQQVSKQTVLEQLLREREQALESHLGEKLTECSSAIAVLQEQLKRSQLTDDERDEMYVAESRIEKAQLQAQQQTRQIKEERQQLTKAQQQRDQANDQLERTRSALHTTELQLQQLYRQLEPEKGSLRHFLQLHYSDWEQNLGKVLNESLLERKDLRPQLDELTDNLYGLQLELAAIDMPEFALDEAAVRHRIYTIEQQLEKKRSEKSAAEKVLKEHHEQVAQIMAQFEQSERQYHLYEKDIEFARSDRDRLKSQQNDLNEQRKTNVQTKLNQQKQRYDSLQQQKQTELLALREDHNTQYMELKTGWQSELQVFDEQITELEQQLINKRTSINTQLDELQQAFNDTLSSRGIDPKKIESVKKRHEQLKTDIRAIEKRQDELSVWTRFMQVSWKQLRPVLLENETTLKQQQRELIQERNQLKANFITNQAQLDEQIQQYRSNMNKAEQLLEQLKQILVRLSVLHLNDISPIKQDTSASIVERLSRTSELLEQRSKSDTQLANQLEQFRNALSLDAEPDFLDSLDHEMRKLPDSSDKRMQLPILEGVLRILKDRQQQLLEMGENIGGDLKKFFTVFNDINRRVALQSRRLSEAVADDLLLQSIGKSEVRILSAIDELGFWQPLKTFIKLYDEWRSSGKAVPSEQYLNALADVVELLRSDEQYSIESLLRLELHLNEGGSDLVIKNDRQLLESSSHGMAYLILCKYLLAFTRLLRGQSQVAIHWPIDEIGTLAYHNVENLFTACSHNRIIIVGAFPNLESDVLMLFKHRYLLEKDQDEPTKWRLKRVQPKVSRLAERLMQKEQEAN